MINHQFKSCFVIVLLACILRGETIIAQNQSDSLWRIWKNEKVHDSLKLRALEKFIELNWYNDNVDSLLYLCKEMHRVSEQSGMEYYLALSYLYGGCFEFNKAKYAKTLELLDKSLPYWEKSGNTERILETMSWKGLTFTTLNQFSKADAVLNKSLELAINSGNKLYIGRSLWFLGNVQFHQGNFSDALVTFQRSLEVYQEINDLEAATFMNYMIGKTLGSQGYYNEAIQQILNCIDSFTKIENISGLTYAYRAVGELYGEIGDYKNAIFYTDIGIEKNKERGENNIQALLMLSRGNINLELDRYILALNDFEQALELFREIDRKEAIARVYNKIGLLYLALNEYENSERYFNLGLESLEGLDQKEYKGDLLHDLSKLFQKTGDYSKSIENLNKSLEISIELGMINKQSEIYYTFGVNYKEQGDFKRALSYLNKSRVIRQDIGDIRGIAEIYLTMGEIQYQIQNYQEALNLMREGNAMATRLGIIKLKQRAAFNLYEIYKAIGKATLALDYLETSLMLQDSLKTNDASLQLLQMEFSRQHLADSIAIVEARLKSELEYQESLTNEKNTRNYIIISGFAILLFSIGLYSRMSYIRKTNKELQQKNQLIALEKERAEESEKAKRQFFNNVSHEFKTPLTLILGTLEDAMEEVSENELKHNLEITQRNARQLQVMINEILELSKMEFGNVHLQAKEINIVAMTKDFLYSFESLAAQQNIKLNFYCKEENFGVWLDEEKYRRILANLISNALKFTHVNGLIKVEIMARTKMDQDGIEVKVTNTGIGIEKEKLPYIFDRFYQVYDESLTGESGTGIGLALTKELVELHHASIMVDSHPGKGCSFSVFFPVGTKHLNADEMVINTEVSSTQNYPESMLDKKYTISENAEEHKAGRRKATQLILIVEDNKDMRGYIIKKLKKAYEILEATDGEEGLKLALEHIPDLIISDVMMPKMNGLILTKKIKTDERTSHIPVLLLTAKASHDNLIEGIETGADAYVTKPFSVRELMVRVEKLIEQREKLRKLFANKLLSGFGDNTTKELLSMDQQFMRKAIDVVNKHLSEVEFDTKKFASEMALSRIQLHRKLKALTSKTTSDFIRTIRLNKAAELLKNRTGTVTEIAYETGFSSLSWFAKVFKEQYGKSPSNYMNSQS